MHGRPEFIIKISEAPPDSSRKPCKWAGVTSANFCLPPDELLWWSLCPGLQVDKRPIESQVGRPSPRHHFHLEIRLLSPCNNVGIVDERLRLLNDDVGTSTATTYDHHSLWETFRSGALSVCVIVMKMCFLVRYQWRCQCVNVRNFCSREDTSY